MPEESGEVLIIETDRQLYCVHEKIFFTVDYKFKYPIENVQWSRVLYVELIRWNGEKITQSKFKLSEKSATGHLTIPGTLLSGNYYIRAYTRWMRNFPVEDYSYRKVKIVNPYESSIDMGPGRENSLKSFELMPIKGTSVNAIECITNKNTFKQREKVDLTIKLNTPHPAPSKFCVSVMKAAHIDTNNYYMHIAEKESPDVQSNIYLPECRGISISGKILNTDTALPSANATLHLSTTQSWKYFTTFRTKDKGLFYFTLPDFYGHYDFYIDAELENGEDADILVDSDYCNRRIQLDYIPFSLDSIEKKTALDLSVNMQLSSIYNEKRMINTLESNELPSFGKPENVYYTGDYIQIPTLEEFFFELVREVRTIRVKQETKIELAAYSQYQNLDPLLLVDNVPALQIDELLNIGVDKIEKIEIFDEPYIVTGKKYSGIICISTKRKDFAGIQLNRNSQFFAYDLLTEDNVTMPDHRSTNADKRTYRQNLLYWDPDIELNSYNSEKLSFYTSDSKGEYIVYIRSTNEKSKPHIYGSCKIVVE